MGYEEIPIEKIQPNPFQTRKIFDSEVMTGIATSAMDNLGIRNAPIVRPHPNGNGMFQLASGEGRLKAWKTLGKTSLMCRVENLTDSQMKKEVLVENVNRSDLSEEERFQALEAYRLDPDTDDPEIRKKLRNKERGWIVALSRETGVADGLIRLAYDVKQIRDLLFQMHAESDEEPTQFLIQRTQGLPDEERVKLVQKAVERGWGTNTVHNVKTALKEMEPEVRELILDKSIKLPQNVIVALPEIPPEKQAETIKHIRAYRYNEEMALNFIDRVKSGEDFTVDVVVDDEIERVFGELERIWTMISGWGVSQRQVLRTRWEEAVAIFQKIEEKMIELRVI